MQVTKEQIFFAVTALLVGLLAYLLATDPYVANRLRAGRGPDEALLIAPAVATSPSGVVDGQWLIDGRDSFAEPREWGPLPSADLARPPLRESSLVPPGPAPRASLAVLGKLRTRSQPTSHEFAGSASAEAGASADNEPVSIGDGDTELLRSEQEELRQRYDWLEVKSSSKPWYGIINNENKYTLNDRRDEPILFQKIDPETDKVKAAGTIPRESLRENGIHLADNTVNRIEYHILSIPESGWVAGSVPRLLDLCAELMEMEAEGGYQFRRAEEELLKYLRVDPKEPRIYELLADARAAQLDFAGELAAFEEAEGKGLDSPGLVVRWSRWYRRYGAREHALSLIQARIDWLGNEQSLLVEKGELLLELGRDAESLASLLTGGELSRSRDERAAVGRRTGGALLALGRFADAESEARKVLGIDQSDVEGNQLLGAAAFAQGRFAEARAAFRAAAERSENPGARARALVGQGLSATRVGAFDDAERLLRYAMVLDPTVGGAAWSGLCWLFESTGHDDLAQDAAAQAVARSPDDPYLRYQWGRQLRRDGDLDGAERELRLALSEGADFPDLFNELGDLALARGDVASAVRYHEESNAREPRDETRIHLGHALIEAANLMDARRQFEQASLSSANTLGAAYCSYRRGETKKAQVAWQSVIAEMPNSPQEDRDYAQRWLDIVLARESKERWYDNIHWDGIGKGWEVAERYGVQHFAEPGRFEFRGPQRPGTGPENWTYLQRQVKRPQFHRLGMEVELGSTNQGRVGVGLVEWTGSFQQEPRARAALLVAWIDGQLSYQQRRNLDDPEAVWRPLRPAQFVTGVPFELGLIRLEREGGEFQFMVDGAAVGEPIEMNQWRGKQDHTLHALFFASAEAGKRVDVALRSAEVVRFRKEP